MPLAFIHIPRTGGRSVFAALGMERVHATAAELNGETFAIIRHPCDHALAWWLNIEGPRDKRIFRRWLLTESDLATVKTPTSVMNPLAQAEWIDHNTKLFRYPDIDGAIAWAAGRMGIRPRDVRIGTNETPARFWQNWYDGEMLAFVRRERAAEFKLMETIP